MYWILTSFATPILFAILIVFDKKLLSEYIPSAKTFFFLIGFFQIVSAGLVFVLTPWDSPTSLLMLSASIGSGIVWALGLILMLNALKYLDASRVTNVYHTYPIFVALLAIILLKEYLSVYQYLAIIITVLGAGLAGIDNASKNPLRGTLPIYALVVIGSFLTAVAMVTWKYALTEMDFWNIFALRSVGLGAVLMGLGYHKNIVLETRLILSNKPALALFVVAEIFFAPIAMVVMLIAFALGPVTLTSTIIATRPFWVFVISAALSTPYLKLLNEPITKASLPVKLLSTVLVVAGITMLTISQ